MPSVPPEGPEKLDSDSPHIEYDKTLYNGLLEINRLFATSLDKPVEKTLLTLSSLLVNYLDLDLAWIVRLPIDGEWVIPMAAAGIAKDYLDGIRITSREDLPEGQGPIGFALRTGEIHRIDVEDAKFEPWRQKAKPYGFGRGLALPFDFPDGEQAVISLHRHVGKPFYPNVEALLVRLSEDLTAFLLHRREREQVQRLLDYQDAIGTLLHGLLVLPEPEVAYSEVIRILVEKTDALGAWISVPVDAYLKTVVGGCKEECSDLDLDLRTFEVPLVDDGSPLSRSTAAQAYRLGRPVIVRDGHGTDLNGLKKAYESLKSAQVAGAWPLILDGIPVAVLVMVSDDREYFTEPLQNLLSQLVDGVGIAIQNHNTQVEAKQKSLLYQALLTEGDLLFTTQDESHFLDEACVRLIESGLFKTVWIGKITEERSVEQVTSCGETTSDLDLLPLLARSNSGSSTASMRAIESGETLYLRDYVNDPFTAPWADLAMRNCWRSSVSSPIERGGKNWGVLTVLSDQTDGFSPGVIELLTKISQLLSHGLNEIDLREELNMERDRQSWLASHDMLTGLPNRRGLEEHISEAITRSKNRETLLAIGMLDLDDFKTLNDKFGHEIGDQVLRDLAVLLRGVLRQTDLLSRVGGDEFVLVLEGVQKFSDLSTVLRKIERVLTTPLLLPSGESAIVGGSLGLAIYSGDDSHPDTLLREADQALYRLKGKKGYRSRDWAFYAPSDPEGISVYPHVSLADRRGTIQNLYQNLLHSEGLKAYYQPIVELASGKVVGAEALARLVSSSGAIYHPAEFINDLSFADQMFLTLRMLEIVLKDLELLENAGNELWCSVNISPEQLVSDVFLSQLTDLLQRHEVSPSKITLEVLEGGNFLSMEDAWQRLIFLKELGIDLAIDDIGSAYSSLLRLRDLPIDKIKLDQEFVRTLGNQPNGFHFLNAMSDLSKGLQVDFIAEGAETEEILDALATLGIPYAQGFAISHPLGFEEFLVWISAHRSVEVQEHPSTVLGLYALHIRQTFIHHQRLNSRLPAPSLGECALQRHLLRLGYEGSEMDTTHRAYHVVLNHFENAFLENPNPYLRSVEEHREALRRSIYDALQKSLKA